MSCRSTQVKIASTDLWPQEMFTFSEMLALVESESSFGAYVCQRRPGGSRAISDLVTGPEHSSSCSWPCTQRPITGANQLQAVLEIVYLMLSGLSHARRMIRRGRHRTHSQANELLQKRQWERTWTGELRDCCGTTGREKRGGELRPLSSGTTLLTESDFCPRKPPYRGERVEKVHVCGEDFEEEREREREREKSSCVQGGSGPLGG